MCAESQKLLALLQLNFFKSTADRRTLNECIADEQYVSSSSALYDVIQRFENGESILDDKWAR